MSSTLWDADTALLCGAGDPPRIGHFYLDVPSGRLHCLNEAARQLRAGGMPLLEADPAVAELRTPRGEAVAAQALPMAIAAREGRLAEAEFVLTRAGQAVRRLKCSATPLKNAAGRIGAVLASVVCQPPPPDWATMAGLAHDLRTPLQTLLTMRHVLDFRTLPELQRQEALQRLSKAAERAQQIAQELLEWCRTRGAAAQGPQRDWFALEDFLREVLAEHTAAAGEKRLTLDATLDAVRGWQVFTDRGRLGRILSNLLVNAVRYTPAGGHVNLAAGWDEKGGARTLVLEVHDTGAGIAAHEHESIFHPFQRGQSGKEQDATGSGVGLSVVDRLTQALGLGCDVRSAAGQGSRFRVHVPQQFLRMAPTSPVAG